MLFIIFSTILYSYYNYTMDMLNNFIITSFDNNDVIINQTTYDIKLDKFPIPFNNIFMSRQRDYNGRTHNGFDNDCSFYEKHRSRVWVYQDIYQQIYYLRTKPNNYINLIGQTSDYSKFIDFVCFMLNEIERVQDVKQLQNKDIKNEYTKIFKLKFSTLNEELIIFCFNLNSTIYNSQKFNLIYKKDNKTILDTIIITPTINYITRDTFSQQLSYDRIEISPDRYHVQLIRTAVAYVFDTLEKHTLRCCDNISYERYNSMQLKYMSELKQKDDEIEQLKQKINQIDFLNSLTNEFNQLRENIQSKCIDQFNKSQKLYDEQQKKYQKDHDKYVLEYYNTSIGLRDEISKLQTEISQKDNIITNNNIKIEQDEKTIDTLTRTVDKHAKEIEQLDIDIDNHIQFRNDVLNHMRDILCTCLCYYRHIYQLFNNNKNNKIFLNNFKQLSKYIKDINDMLEEHEILKFIISESNDKNDDALKSFIYDEINADDMLYPVLNKFTNMIQYLYNLIITINKMNNEHCKKINEITNSTDKEIEKLKNINIETTRQLIDAEIKINKIQVRDEIYYNHSL